MKKWILGIVGSVLAAVLGFWLTTGLHDWWQSPPAPEPQSYSWDGRVKDDKTDQLLSNVEVSLEIRSQISTQKTDSEGRYIFLFPRSVEPFTADLKAAAQNYQPFTRHLTLASNGELERQSEIALKRAEASAPVNASLPQAVPKEMAKLILYQPKQKAQATKVVVPLIPR
jgi:hypothetical protein